MELVSVLAVYLAPGHKYLAAAKQAFHDSLLYSLAQGPLPANQQQAKGIHCKDKGRGDFCIMTIRDAWQLFQPLMDSTCVTAFECLFEQGFGMYWYKQ
jgi:hypothetical protein